MNYTQEFLDIVEVTKEQLMKLKKVPTMIRFKLEAPGKKPAMIIMPLSFSNNEDKHKAQELLRKVVSDTPITHYIFVTDAWMRLVKMSEGWDGKSASESTDKTEVLIICKFSRDMNHEEMIIPYKRDKYNVITFEEPLSEMTDSASAWNFFVEDTVAERMEKFRK